MAAQRQKLEQAVDAWRRDAEHWRARYDSLATPGALSAPPMPVACSACRPAASACGLWRSIITSRVSE